MRCKQLLTVYIKNPSILTVRASNHVQGDQAVTIPDSGSKRCKCKHRLGYYIFPCTTSKNSQINIPFTTHRIKDWHKKPSSQPS